MCLFSSIKSLRDVLFDPLCISHVGYDKVSSIYGVLTSNLSLANFIFWIVSVWIDRTVFFTGRLTSLLKFLQLGAFVSIAFILLWYLIRC